MNRHLLALILSLITGSALSAAQESPDFSKLSKEQLIAAAEDRLKFVKESHEKMLAGAETALEIPDAQCAEILHTNLTCLPKVLLPLIMSYGKPELPRNLWPTTLEIILMHSYWPCMVTDLDPIASQVMHIERQFESRFGVLLLEPRDPAKQCVYVYPPAADNLVTDKRSYLDNCLLGYATDVYDETSKAGKTEYGPKIVPYVMHRLLTGYPRIEKLKTLQ